MKLLEEKTVTQLLSYIENILYLRLSNKCKGRDTGNIIPLILPTGIVGSMSPILSAYTQQITLLEFNISSNDSFFKN